MFMIVLPPIWEWFMPPVYGDWGMVDYCFPHINGNATNNATYYGEKT